MTMQILKLFTKINQKQKDLIKNLRNGILK